MVDGIQEFIESIQDTYAEPSKTYRAEVSRIDNEGVVWVYLAGSNMETPTAVSSSEISVGDNVNVEWRNNKLYIAGNVTNPSAGVARVATVEQAASQANQNALQAQDDASDAMDRANDSYTIAANTDQYFWTTETGSDTGAHITEYPKDEWNDSEGSHYHSGGNLLARSNGIAVRNGMTELATFNANGIDIKSGGASVANFGASTVRLGKTNASNMKLTTPYAGRGELTLNNGSTEVGELIFDGGDGWTFIALQDDTALLGIQMSDHATGTSSVFYGVDISAGAANTLSVTQNLVSMEKPLYVGDNKIITVQTFNADNISVTANGYKEGTISIAKTGYTPIGVLDMYINNASSSGSGSSFVTFYRSYISGTTYYYGIRSVTSSATKVRVYAKILYIATSQGI